MMKPREYTFRIDELDIDTDIIEKFMGYEAGTSPEPIPSTIQEVLLVARKYCDIKGGYVIMENVSVDRKNHLLNINDISFSVKNIISGQLRKIEKTALFLCTAGPGLEEYSKKLMHEGDFIKGYIADIVGSEIVESAMARIQDDLEQQMKQTGLGITDRYSPGYCGWSVAEQHKLFSFFPENFCGITLNETSLMQPIKSVSGVIGIGKGVKRKGYVCHHCDMVNCIYREKRYTKKPDRC